MGKLKTAFVVCLIACVAFAGVAGLVTSGTTGEYHFPVNQQNVWYSYTTLTGTNGVTGTNSVNSTQWTYHTFDVFYTATGTNNATFALDKTCDGTNWIILSTNTFTASGSFSTNFLGKWTSFRARVYFQNTNAANFLWNYNGQ